MTWRGDREEVHRFYHAYRYIEEAVLHYHNTIPYNMFAKCHLLVKAFDLMEVFRKDTEWFDRTYPEKVLFSTEEKSLSLHEREKKNCPTCIDKNTIRCPYVEPEQLCPITERGWNNAANSMVFLIEKSIEAIKHLLDLRGCPHIGIRGFIYVKGALALLEVIYSFLITESEGYRGEEDYPPAKYPLTSRKSWDND